MSDDYEQPDGTAARHATARAMAERAVQAQADGEDEAADRLFAEAARVDPDAVADVLAAQADNPGDTATGADSEPQDDEEIAAMSRTIQPNSDAPSRAGIGGSGSGADDQGTGRGRFPPGG